MYNNLNHFDKDGKANMVDVSEKEVTTRVAKAFGKIKVNSKIIDLIKSGEMGKGDVLGVARTAGIMASKKTSELIPMCHLLLISSAKVDFNIDEENSYIEVIATVKTEGKTGVEMEALTAASTALLTIYDMCKAVDKRMVIEGIHLLEKTGGKSGNFKF